MNRSANKAERLKEIERLLLQRRDGFTAQQLADRFNVSRTTVWRDIESLRSTVPIQENERGVYTIDRMCYMTNVRLRPTEALMLYLAARRLSRQTRVAHLVVTDALEKLALTLQQPMMSQLEAAASYIMSQSRIQPKKEKVIETIVRAWINALPVRIRHRKLHGGQLRSYVVKPYFIEPSIWPPDIQQRSLRPVLSSCSRWRRALLHLELNILVKIRRTKQNIISSTRSYALREIRRYLVQPVVY